MIQRTHPTPRSTRPTSCRCCPGASTAPQEGRLLHGAGLLPRRGVVVRPPACTHPLLASLARDVNDHVDDYARSRLLR